MQTLRFLAIFLLAFSLEILGQTPTNAELPTTQGPQTTPSQRSRPRFDPQNPSVHDPVMTKEGDTYYLFQTGNGIGHITSKDLKTWDIGKSVFTGFPEWIKSYLPNFRGHIWAPDICFYKDRFHIFYSCSAFGKNTSVIGHASSPTLNPENPAFGWTDHGIIIQSVPNRDMWNAIDPNIIVDDSGVPWMSFGSFWDGIKLFKLSDDLMSVAKPETWYSLCRRQRTHSLEDNNPGDGAVEAPFIFKHGDYYYLFVSYDFCCRGLRSDYNIIVGRSKLVTGPYLDREGLSLATGGGTVVMKGDETYAGVGHCAVYHMDDTDYLIAHGYSKAENGASKLVMREIEWDSDGWPLVHVMK